MLPKDVKMDGGDVFIAYLAVGLLLLFCFFYACCTNLKEDCKGNRSVETYSPCAEKDIINGDLETRGVFANNKRGGNGGGGCIYTHETGGSCDV